MPQIFQIGDHVRVRGQRWTVVDMRQHEACCLLALSGTDEANHGVAAQLLTPFDTPEAIIVRQRVRRVGPACWRRGCRRTLATIGGADALRTAAGAHMDLLPHQLEPALAIVRGHTSRVLIADEVGLGKTVQAALVVKELMARGAATRVLVLAPAGLRDQWVEECRMRFDLAFTVIDAAELRRRRAVLPAGVNPWTTEPLAIASLDFVKRPEVLPAVRASRWDVVIVDEAHHAAGRHDRHRAVAALTARAAYVVLLTATPHNGDQALFDALRDLGAHDDPLMTFRRTRRDIGRADDRRTHLLPVRCTRAEVRMHAALATFVRAVERDHGFTSDVRLALSILQKRALSSAFALWQSVDRRLRSLDSITEDTVAQLALPLEETAELDAEDAAPRWSVPSLADARTERHLLARVSTAARQASLDESKLRVLSRLLRRVGQPVLVFTEYRDTLEHVRRMVMPRAPVIHGGLTREERRAAIRAFRTAPILLATDAAGEGLNLQQRCRIVVSLELPWNPVRLEQRIGRVDRIGQTRRVHVFHLMAAGSFEERIRQRLESRIARTRAELGHFDPLGSMATPGAASSRPAVAHPTAEADAEHRRLTHARGLLAHKSGADNATQQQRRGRHEAATLVWFSKRRHLRVRLGRGALVLVQSTLTDESGRMIAVWLTPIRVPEPGDVSGMLAWLSVHVAHESDASKREWFEASQRVHRAFWSTRLRRELGLAHTVSPVHQDHQPGLFDRRYDARHDEWRRQDSDARAEAEAREHFARRMGIVHTRVSPALVLVV